MQGYICNFLTIIKAYHSDCYTAGTPNNGSFKVIFLKIRSVSCCFSCVGVDEDDAPDIDVYHCPNCEKNHGKSTCKCQVVTVAD